VARYVRSHSKF